MDFVALADKFGWYVAAIVATAAGLVKYAPAAWKYFDARKDKRRIERQKFFDGYLDKMEKMQNECKNMMITAASDYQTRLDKKDERLDTVVNSTYEAIHDFREVLGKQNNLILDVRDELAGVRQISPVINEMTGQVTRLGENVGKTVEKILEISGEVKNIKENMKK